MIGAEPVEEEIPLEISDFPFEVQEIFRIYSKLRDIWDGMSGTYMGKETSIMFEYLKLYEVDDWKLAEELITYISAIQQRIHNDKKKREKASQQALNRASNSTNRSRRPS